MSDLGSCVREPAWVRRTTSVELISSSTAAQIDDSTANPKPETSCGRTERLAQKHSGIVSELTSRTGFYESASYVRHESPAVLLHRWLTPIRFATAERVILDRIRVKGTCWEHTSMERYPGTYPAVMVRQYGYVRFVASHRWLFALLHGHIPSGRYVDHICENKRCVNPDHLHLVTPRQNSLLHEKRMAEFRVRGRFGRIVEVAEVEGVV